MGCICQYKQDAYIQNSMSSKGNVLDVTPSNQLPHPLSPPHIPLCVIQVQKFVAKQHPITANTKLDVYANSNGIHSATA